MPLEEKLSIHALKDSLCGKSKTNVGHLDKRHHLVNMFTISRLRGKYLLGEFDEEQKSHCSDGLPREDTWMCG